MTYTYQEITKVTREFRDLANDLLNSNHSTFDTTLNFFRDYCNETELIQEILLPVINNQYDTDAWYSNAIENQSSMVGSGDPTLPTKQIDALKVIYDILWSAEAKNRVINFIYNTMFTKRFDDMINRFNVNFTHRLIRYILRNLEDRIELVKPQSLQYGNTFNTFNGPTNYVANGHTINQNIQINNPGLLEIVNQMREVIDKCNLPLNEKQDALETIDMIETEVSKQSPSKSRISKLLTLLPTMDSLASLGDTILSNLPL